MLIMTQSFHPLILIAMDEGQTAGWLLTLLAGLLTLLTLWPVAAFLRSVPGATLIDLARLAAGRVGAVITGVLLAGVLSFMGGTILRETSEMAITASYPHTPQTFATTSLLLGAIFVAYGDGSALVRLGRLLLPAVVGSFLLVLAGTVGWGEIQYLLPFWGPGPVSLLLEAPSAAMFFAPAALLPLLTDGVSDRSSLVRSTLAVPSISALLLALEKAVLGMVFPYPLGTDVTFPFHGAARIVLTGRFFERLEGIWVFMWVMSTTVLSGALLYGGASAVARSFSMPRHTTAVLPLATVVLTVAFFPRNQADTITLHERAGPWLFALALALPAVLAVAAALRRRRRCRET